jgi:hypothetical protein
LREGERKPGKKREKMITSFRVFFRADIRFFRQFPGLVFCGSSCVVGAGLRDYSGGDSIGKWSVFYWQNGHDKSSVCWGDMVTFHTTRVDDIIEHKFCLSRAKSEKPFTTEIAENTERKQKMLNRQDAKLGKKSGSRFGGYCEKPFTTEIAEYTEKKQEIFNRQDAKTPSSPRRQKVR